MKESTIKLPLRWLFMLFVIYYSNTIKSQSTETYEIVRKLNLKDAISFKKTDAYGIATQTNSGSNARAIVSMSTTESVEFDYFEGGLYNNYSGQINLYRTSVRGTNLEISRNSYQAQYYYEPFFSLLNLYSGAYDSANENTDSIDYIKYMLRLAYSEIAEKDQSNLNWFFFNADPTIDVQIKLTLENGMKLSDIKKIELPGIPTLRSYDFRQKEVDNLRNILENPNQYPNYVMLAAHRGYWKYAPENSLEAFKSAIDIGADLVEIDLGVTADQEIMIAHDSHLGRITNIPNKLKNQIFQKNSSSSFQETQLHTFTYKIQEGDKFFISFYNPNGAKNWQLRMDLSKTGVFTQIGGNGYDPPHDLGAVDGWTQVSMDLSSYVDEYITKIQIFPAATQSTIVYYDKIFIESVSLPTSSKTYFFQNGSLLTGSLFLNGTIETSNPLPDINNPNISVLQTKGEDNYLLSKMKLCDIRPDLCIGNPDYNADNPNNCNSCTPTPGINNTESLKLIRPDGTIAEKIPTIKEAFDMFLENTPVLINIDKIEPGDPNKNEVKTYYFDKIYELAKEKKVLERVIVKSKIGRLTPDDFKASKVIDWSKWYLTPTIFPGDQCNGSMVNCMKIFMEDPVFNCPGAEYIYLGDNEPDFEEMYEYIRKTMNNRIFQFPTYPENGAGVWIRQNYFFSDKFPSIDRLNDWNWLLNEKRRPDVIISDRFELLKDVVTELGLRQK